MRVKDEEKSFRSCTRLGILLLIYTITGSARPTIASPDSQVIPPDPNLSISDQVCLSCHGQPGQTLELLDGSLWDLYIPEEAYKQSIHGELGYACVQCHRDVGNYPHPPFQASDLRDSQLKLNDTCKFCHIQQFELSNDSVHAVALSNGVREAAICIDCHTAHDVRRLTDPTTRQLLPDARTWIPQTCARCHSTIYEKYKDSVHGSALIGQGNPDVPTCIDCHGVHNIPDPTTASFRLSSPEMCGKCHTDSTVVGKYGLSTDVLNTYVADFHGTTVTLFEKQSPVEQTNKPVCYDCHGIHDISRSSDPQKGLAVRQNLLARCQECHPNATDNFPESWLSHYIPSPDKYPAVYYVDVFYKFFIPGVLGFMGLLVVMDFSRAAINRLQRRMKRESVEPPSVSETEISSELAPTPAPAASEETASPIEELPTESQLASPDPEAPQDDPSPTSDNEQADHDEIE
jgi:hypothetical protein